MVTFATVPDLLDLRHARLFRLDAPLPRSVMLTGRANASNSQMNAIRWRKSLAAWELRATEVDGGRSTKRRAKSSASPT